MDSDFVVDVSVGAGLPVIYWSLHCDQLRLSVTISICCKEKLLWWRVRAIAIGGCKDKF